MAYLCLIHAKLDTDIDWVDLADDVRHEYMVVDNLRPSHGYKFRVLACNKFGWSIPSIPSPIVMTPSSGASKAEFYDALQRLQAKEDINLVKYFLILLFAVGILISFNWFFIYSSFV